MPARLMRRRWLLASVPTLLLASAAGRAAGGDLAVTCDTTLAPALRKVAGAYKARFGGHVFIFATGPGLILPQLVHDIQNDIVVTQTAILEQAAQAGVIAAPVRAQWRNPLVIAGRAGATATDGAFAVTDPSPASDIDGPALLARLAIKPARTLGAVDTDEVAFLLTTGAAQAGLLHMTDVRADARLAAVRPVPTEVQPPALYAAAVTRLARRPKPEDFVAFLLTTGAAQAGLLHMTDVRADARLAAIRPVPAEAQPPPLYAAAVTRLARRPNPEDFVAFLTTKEAGDILAAAGLEAII